MTRPAREVFGPAEWVANRDVGNFLQWPYDNVDWREVNRGYFAQSAAIPSDHHSPTPYSTEVVRVTEDTPYVTREVSGTGTNVSTRYISAGVTNPAFWGYPSNWGARMGNAEDRSITLARQRLRRKDSYELGTALAEARKTGEMLADAAGEMAKKGINLFRYANQLTQGKRNALLAVAGAYLQGKYGWGSLAQDVFNLHEKLKSDLKEPLEIIASANSKIAESYGPQPGWGGGSDWKGLSYVRYTALIEDEFSRALDGWGVINPFSVAWETVPYSFVVDWFIPVGNTLSSITATAGLEFGTGFVSTKHEASIRFSYERRYWEEVLNPGRYSYEVMKFGRHLLGGFAPPRLYANENPFSTSRIEAGLALLTQLIYRGHR